MYHSALLLSPPCLGFTSTIVQSSHKVKVVKGHPAEWGACSCTVSLDGYALSYWNDTIAVGCWGGDIIVLDGVTGRQMGVLSGHNRRAISVTFSSDGRLLVSGSEDTTVKLWDIQTGGVIKTFYGHTDRVWSVSISVDCSRIISGSSDKTICLWSIQTGECLCIIHQQHTVFHLSFSLTDPQYIISTSGDKVLQWDVNGHQIPPTYDGTYFAFSPDHAQIALCNQKVVTVQESDSRAILAQFHVASGKADCCCFSPDGKLVAAAADNTIYVWDITCPNPHLIETFVGHTMLITSLVFSSPSTLISASQDKSVKFWQIGIPSTDKLITSPQSTSLSLTPILFVSLQAGAGIAISGDEDEVVKTWDISTGLCKASFKAPLTNTPNWAKRDAKLIDGRLILICSHLNQINIWDVEKGEHLKTLDGPWSTGLRISGDGSKFFSLGPQHIHAWPMWTWEPIGVAEVELGEEQYLDPLCIQNSRVWIHSKDSSAQEGWDFGVSGSPPVKFDPSTGRPHLNFIGGASWWTDGPCWIEGTVAGRSVFN
jgi:WD40 repeat protein